MSLTRNDVLEELSVRTDWETERYTTVEALNAALDGNDGTVRAHLDALNDCDFAKIDDDRVRITRSGEEFLALDIDGPAVVSGLDSTSDDAPE